MSGNCSVFGGPFCVTNSITKKQVQISGGVIKYSRGKVKKNITSTIYSSAIKNIIRESGLN